MKLSLLLFSIFLFVFQPSIYGQSNVDIPNTDSSGYKWEKASVSLGMFIAGLNSDIRIGSQDLGLGIIVNLEDALGLNNSTTVFRGAMEFGFGKNKNQSARIGYFGFARSATKILESEIEIGDFVFPIGSEVSSRFDMKIIAVEYDYYYFTDKRIQLGLSAGLFIMPIKFSTKALGGSGEASDIIAPLPVFGLRNNFALTSKLVLKQNIEVLYLNFTSFKGIITDINVHLEYRLWNNFGLGLGLNSFALNLSAYKQKSELWNFEGTFKTGYTGLLFYCKYSF